jgi:tetratricopeptide (TPR) repeat protein
MKNILFLYAVSFSLIIFMSCTDKKDNLLKEINTLEEALKQDVFIDKTQGQKLIDLYVDFTQQFPKDSLVAGMLYNAARLTVSIDNPKPSIEYLERIIIEYPESPLVSESYIYLGFVYETVFHDYELARHWYELFITDFPNHPLMEDISITLQNLGKTPDEIVAEFLLQNEKNESNDDSE